ncbi:hypothetical protein ACFL6Y_03440 [Elusimicrobiota bacterium]
MFKKLSTVIIGFAFIFSLSGSSLWAESDADYFKKEVNKIQKVWSEYKVQFNGTIGDSKDPLDALVVLAENVLKQKSCPSPYDSLDAKIGHIVEGFRRMAPAVKGEKWIQTPDGRRMPVSERFLMNVAQNFEDDGTKNLEMVFKFCDLKNLENPNRPHDISVEAWNFAEKLIQDRDSSRIIDDMLEGLINNAEKLTK